jgi:hypothetical protein
VRVKIVAALIMLGVGALVCSILVFVRRRSIDTQLLGATGFFAGVGMIAVAIALALGLMGNGKNGD